MTPQYMPSGATGHAHYSMLLPWQCVVCAFSLCGRVAQGRVDPSLPCHMAKHAHMHAAIFPQAAEVVVRASSVS